MKFYYGDQLVRTSKTHHYTHAAVTEKGACIGCSSTYTGALKAIEEVKRDAEHHLSSAEAALEARLNGAKYAKYTWNGKVKTWQPLPFQTVEYLENEIKDYKEYLDRIASYRVVELEER